MENNNDLTLKELSDLKDFQQLQISSHYVQSEETFKIARWIFKFLLINTVLLFINLILLGFIAYNFI